MSTSFSVGCSSLLVIWDVAGLSFCFLLLNHSVARPHNRKVAFDAVGFDKTSRDSTIVLRTRPVAPVEASANQEHVRYC